MSGRRWELPDKAAWGTSHAVELLAEGWEPFAAQGDYIWFRRLVENKGRSSDDTDLIIRQGRRMEAAVAALREIAATDPSDCDWQDVPLARDVLALLSRLDTLEAELAPHREGTSPTAKMLDAAVRRCRAAEAQVEALTEALREIAATDPSDCDWQDVAQAYERLAREALSRVSRSEPAPPNDDQGANSADYAEIRKDAVFTVWLEPERVYACEKCGAWAPEPGEPTAHNRTCSHHPDPDYSPAYQDEYQRLWHESQAEVRRLREELAAAAPPVPEEQP